MVVDGFVNAVFGGGVSIWILCYGANRLAIRKICRVLGYIRQVGGIGAGGTIVPLNGGIYYVDVCAAGVDFGTGGTI